MLFSIVVCSSTEQVTTLCRADAAADQAHVQQGCARVPPCHGPPLHQRPVCFCCSSSQDAYSSTCSLSTLVNRQFWSLHYWPARCSPSKFQGVTCHRELTHYKGEPDPLKGDVPNQRVRDAAREALDALFGAENGYAPTSAPAQPQLTVRRLNGWHNMAGNLHGQQSGLSSNAFLLS